jgi:ferric-dicitrate binding protein FerR (iron transport regulator)
LAVLVTTAALAWYLISSGNRNELTSRPVQDYADIRLTIDDSRRIDIPSDRSQIVYSSDGELIEVNGEVVAKHGNAGHSRPNQLIVPFGKQAKVVLADGTEVWLNAGSRLVYPSKFDTKKRKVQLQGEAFFKVSKDKTRPFLVETNRSSVKVLGTSFNLKAYPDETTEETVLVEGSVSINIGKTLFGKDILLKPDQRMIAGYPDRSYSVSEVEVQNYTSWTEGSLAFKEEPLSRVLSRIARFYNVRIRCEDADENRKITGKLDLKQDYLRVLKALELISQGNYTEKNGTITFKLNGSNDQ